MSPNRRSLVDIERALEALLSLSSGSDRCSIQELPALVDRYEKEKNVVLLLADEKAALAEFAVQVPDNTVTAQDLVPLFAMLTKSQNELDVHQTKALPARPLSIGSFESDEGVVQNGAVVELSDSGAIEASPTNAPFPKSQSQPDSLTSAKQSRIPRHSHSRSQTVPSPINIVSAASPTSPTLFTTRQRSAPLETGDHGKRPIPRRPASAKNKRPSIDETSAASRGTGTRAGSTTPTTSPLGWPHREDSNYDRTSPIPRSIKTPQTTSLPRSQSDSAIPKEDKDNQDPSPPSAQLHTDAFHPQLLSPTAEEDASPDINSGLALLPVQDRSFKISFENPLGRANTHALSRDASQTSSHGSDGSVSRPTSLFVGEAFGNNSTGGFAFRPDSIASLNNISSVSADELTQLLRTLQDYAKRNKELERQKEAQSEDHEATLVEIQGRLDDVQAEVVVRRREEKELRVKEKQNQDAIGLLESEISKTQASLKSQRELMANTKKQLEEQRVDADKLRSSIRGKDHEIRQSETALHELSAQNARSESERRHLETRLKTLDEELVSARQTSHELEMQKIENGKLKETVDSLKHEVESLMARMRLSSSSSISLDGSSPQRRTLGSEINSGSPESATEDDSDSTDTEAPQSRSKDNIYERHVVYRTRTVRPGQTLAREVSVEETTDVEAVDEAVQTDCVATTTSSSQTDNPPPYEGHSKSPESAVGHPNLADDDVWNRWVLDMASRTTYTANIARHIPSELHTFLFKSVTTVTCTVALFYFAGFFTGATLFRTTCRHFPSSDALWLQYNSFEAFNEPTHTGLQARLVYWFQELMRSGVERIMRVPT